MAGQKKAKNAPQTPAVIHPSTISSEESFGTPTVFVVCIQNEGYEASLEVRKIYTLIRDDRATEHDLVRIVDESGEDYLYPADYFVPVELPQAVAKVFSQAS